MRTAIGIGRRRERSPRARCICCHAFRGHQGPYVNLGEAPLEELVHVFALGDVPDRVVGPGDEVGGAVGCGVLHGLLCGKAGCRASVKVMVSLNLCIGPDTHVECLMQQA